MARDKLGEFQTSYAEAMQRYGLKRGKKGSKAKHIDNQTHYRNLIEQGEKVEENIEGLKAREKEIRQRLEQAQSEEKIQQFKGKVLDSISSVFDKTQVEQLKKENEDLKNQILYLTNKISSQDKSIQENRLRYEEEIKKAKNYISYILDLLPDAKQLLDIGIKCNAMQIPSETVKKLLKKIR